MSYPVPLFQNESSRKPFIWRNVLTQRQKPTWRWPISFHLSTRGIVTFLQAIAPSYKRRKNFCNIKILSKIDVSVERFPWWPPWKMENLFLRNWAMWKETLNVAVGNRSFGKYGSAMHPGSLVMFVERPLGISLCYFPMTPVEHSSETADRSWLFDKRESLFFLHKGPFRLAIDFLMLLMTEYGSTLTLPVWKT